MKRTLIVSCREPGHASGGVPDFGGVAVPELPEAVVQGIHRRASSEVGYCV